jgi:hypothetical protein
MTELPNTPPKPPETPGASKPAPVTPRPVTPPANTAPPAIPSPGAARPPIPPVVTPARTPEKPVAKPVTRESVPTSPRARSVVLPVLYLLGFVILAGAIAWIWKNPPMPDQPPVGAMQAQIDELQGRISRLEARPESRPAAAFDPAPLLARIAALEARPSAAAPDLSPIRSQLAALEARPTPSPADAALTQRVQVIARVQTIAAALEAGHKLGAVPDAPPALQRFADVEPPTEAGLRLAFPAAARAGLVASRPIDPDLPVLSRIWGRLQELITIRQGERVLVGDPAAGVVAAAQKQLDAGDLAGAVAALGRLNPPAEQAMSGWIGQAKALLDARAALASMAARG